MVQFDCGKSPVTNRLNEAQQKTAAQRIAEDMLDGKLDNRTYAFNVAQALKVLYGENNAWINSFTDVQLRDMLAKSECNNESGSGVVLWNVDTHDFMQRLAATNDAWNFSTPEGMNVKYQTILPHNPSVVADYQSYIDDFNKDFETLSLIESNANAAFEKVEAVKNSTDKENAVNTLKKEISNLEKTLETINKLSVELEGDIADMQTAYTENNSEKSYSTEDKNEIESKIRELANKKEAPLVKVREAIEAKLQVANETLAQLGEVDEIFSPPVPILPTMYESLNDYEANFSLVEEKVKNLLLEAEGISGNIKDISLNKDIQPEQTVALLEGEMSAYKETMMKLELAKTEAANMDAGLQMQLASNSSFQGVDLSSINASKDMISKSSAKMEQTLTNLEQIVSNSKSSLPLSNSTVESWKTLLDGNHRAKNVMSIQSKTTIAQQAYSEFIQAVQAENLEIAEQASRKISDAAKEAEQHLSAMNIEYEALLTAYNAEKHDMKPDETQQAETFLKGYQADIQNATVDVENINLAKRQLKNNLTKLQELANSKTLNNFKKTLKEVGMNFLVGGQAIDNQFSKANTAVENFNQAANKRSYETAKDQYESIIETQEKVQAEYEKLIKEYQSLAVMYGTTLTTEQKAEVQDGLKDYEKMLKGSEEILETLNTYVTTGKTALENLAKAPLNESQRKLQETRLMAKFKLLEDTAKDKGVKKAINKDDNLKSQIQNLKKSIQNLSKDSSTSMQTVHDIEAKLSELNDMIERLSS